MRKISLIWAVFCAVVLLGSALRNPVAQQADASVLLPAASKYIALTFDDGPKRGTTDVLLDGLKERGISATFFLVGDQIAGKEDLVRRMHAEGHQVGNHTWSHAALLDAPEETILCEIQKTEDLLSEILGGSGYWVRPPYGLIRANDREAVAVPLVKWSLDPRDWEHRNAQTVLQAILKATEANSIILLHDIYPSSVEAALRSADALQEAGYLLVTVEELLALNGVEPRAGTMYRNGEGATAWE